MREKNERKDFIEWYVVEQTIKYVLTSDRIHDLECRIAAANRDMDRAVDEIMRTDITAVRDRLSAKVAQLEQQKADLEIYLSKLKIANGIRYTVTDIEAWLRQFCSGDIMDAEFQHRIIDVFINAVYLYDDKVIIFYNIKGGKQVSYMEMIDSTSDGELGTDEVNCEKVRISGVMAHHIGKPVEPHRIKVPRAFFISQRY